MSAGPDTDAAVTFLEAWEGDGPWLLTAIEPDARGEIETRAFDDPEAMRHWIDRQQARRNLYFSVNRTRPGLRSKATKNDIRELVALHTDIDPPKAPGLDLGLAQQQILDRLKAHQPPPSAIVFSGGGYQGFWRLDEPVPVNGNIAELEAYNVALEKALGGDHCHNIDRIMRVPGTVNLPDATKRKAGRTAVTAELICFDLNRVYTLADFTPHQAGGGSGARGGRDASRSAAAFRKGRDLRRAGRTFEEMVQALRDDPETAEWCRDKGEANDQRELHRIWDKAGGDAVSLDDFYGYMPDHSYIFIPTRAMWPASSVNARIPPINVGSDEKGEPIELRASTWLDQNRPVEQMTWAPGLSEIIEDRLLHEGGWLDRPGGRCFNQYLAPTIVPGDARRADRWLDHGRLVFPDDAEHIARWLAHRVQRPYEKINHAILLGGAQGIGKDTLLEPVRHAIGPWNFKEASPLQVLGRFNGFLKSVVLRISEARDLGEFDRFKFYDHMKAYTAAPPDTLRVDEKHLREYSILNVCGVIITTNHKTDGIYLPSDDRRHFVAWSDLSKDDDRFAGDYWRQLYAYYEDGGTEAVTAYLQQLDISSFDPKAPPPKTEGFWAIVDAHRSSEESELDDILDLMGRPDAFTLGDLLRAAEYQPGGVDGGLIDWLKDRKNRRVIPHRLEKCGYVPVRNPDDAHDGQWRINGKRRAVYARQGLSLRTQRAAARSL